MKRNLFLFPALILVLFIAFASCKDKKESEPCDNKGTLWVENKMDTTITVFIMPVREQYTLTKNFSQSSKLSGNVPYTITISKDNYQWDTTMMIVPCDNKILIINNP
ncbi:MAG: hypothetical protein Q8867_06525 [Bacteroidota bacterium]|nr:hypothetical protein [Bacteroidota bacterium]